MERKRPRETYLNLDDGEEEKEYKFKVLLPNGTSVMVKLSRSGDGIQVQELISEVKSEFFRTFGSEIVKGRRRVIWKDPSVYLEDVSGVKVTKFLSFEAFGPNECHYLKLHDGVKDSADTFENMWDLTPDTDMLKELPDEYTFETALADLIDNSLQAVWSNGPNETKLVSVTVEEHAISIFDTGPGMDGNDKSSLVKWGKIGASLHRSSRSLAIGGKPPYLTPFFGMFGYGGAIASMHLGRHALVSSKTKDSKKVYTLHLERQALLKGEKTWKTDGSIRDPLEEEIVLSPHGSFTKVVISEPKIRSLDPRLLKCRLKDIYFPYIQCDEMSGTGRTTTPVKFQVNGDDLADLEGGEVAITNLHSCNGPEFVLQLHFLVNQHDTAISNSVVKSFYFIHEACNTSKCLGSRVSQEAHARLKCVYFPVVEGKETIDTILESLEEDECRAAETFDTFSRVSIRRLGRLLPDARWGRLPFMDFRQRRGDRAQVLKRCSMRIKCFVETDAGFNPTPSKTDLAHHHPCTKALRNLGIKSLEKENYVTVKILKDGKPLSLSLLEKEYENWVFKMHDLYDKVECGEDQPVYVLNPCNKKALVISSDVVRVHKVIKRKGSKWEAGQHIKIFKGVVGCHNSNLYATLEYILLEGVPEDGGGDARLICRPLHVPLGKGCLLKEDIMITTLDIQDSMSFPISVIDLEKCKVVEDAEWAQQLEKLHMKAPSKIDILSAQECQNLEIDGALAFGHPVFAGHAVPKKIVAVVRPACFNSLSSSRSLDQKYIVKDDLGMSMEVKYASEDGSPEVKHVHSERIQPTSHSGIQGLYIFSMWSTHMNLIEKSGVYTFVFNLNSEGSSQIKCEKLLTVLKSTQGTEQRAFSDKRSPTCHVRIPRSSGGKTIEKEFQAEKRVRIVSPVPKFCNAGSHSEGISMEIVNSEGGVDETIHDTVSVVRPQISHLENLNEHEDVKPFQISNGGMPPIQGSPAVLSKDKQPFMESVMTDSQELENMFRVGTRIGDREKKLKLLNEKNETIMQGIFDLQEFIEPRMLKYLDYFLHEKEVISRHIEGKGDTAASIICEMLKVIQWPGIIGVVALLGTVTLPSLSRMLAEYLGTDHMLAVVCKTYETASNLESYEEHGKVNYGSKLHEAAAELGKSINGRFLVICLEEIRKPCTCTCLSDCIGRSKLFQLGGSPYTGKIERNDLQGKLALPNPLLQAERTPPGFLGYAVNMINLEAPHFHTRTAKGYGLRETLFYLLFGQLQVYETREYMIGARSSINRGAVSLDGGIIKPNGVLSLGDWEPEICFPVASIEVQRQLDPKTVDILRQITLKKLELEAASVEIEKENRAYSEDLRDFHQNKYLCENYLKSNKSCVDGLHIDQNVSSTE
ncbi:hypothetical protein IFM89_014918 [Coptis chinensis]|uniref:Gamma-irradiation and mitomycin c induced 1 n=1 Tax=Coptis chinensis TaxID=261450 RepID=A0A835H6D6_9MAGN|nr:hypothetical protein IFM89_014918 [Coptis chinensis]